MVSFGARGDAPGTNKPDRRLGCYRGWTLVVFPKSLRLIMAAPSADTARLTLQRQLLIR